MKRSKSGKGKAHNFGVGQQVVVVGEHFNGYHGRVDKIYEGGGVGVCLTHDRSSKGLDTKIPWDYYPDSLRPLSVQ